MTIFFVITTNSRNALVGLIISFFTLININKFSRYFLIGTASFIVFINYLTNFFNQLKSKIYFDLLPFCQHGSDTSLFCKLIYFNAGLENPRIRIWLSTLSIIKDRPIWGWGSSSGRSCSFRERRARKQNGQGGKIFGSCASLRER